MSGRDGNNHTPTRLVANDAEVVANEAVPKCLPCSSDMK
jgi:hypothetical protein